MNVVVRAARGSDVDAIAACWRDLLLHHAARDPALGVRDTALTALAGEARRAIAEVASRVFVAEAAGAFAGFCTIRFDAAPRVLRERARAAITELVVVPAARRRGVGRALVEEALAWARAQGADRVEVRVAARNAEAQAFWRAQGFGDFVDVLDRRL